VSFVDNKIFAFIALSLEFFAVKFKLTAEYAEFYAEYHRVLFVFMPFVDNKILAFIARS
jgi:hypothetical protein